MFLIFGVLTTAVNLVAYYLCYNAAGIRNIPSAVIAWILAVCFAFITNKMWVFNSQSFSAKVLVHEIPSFFGARSATGLLDVGIMYLTVDLLHGNSTLWKLFSNVLVIIINYIASKLIVFKKTKDREAEHV